MELHKKIAAVIIAAALTALNSMMLNSTANAADLKTDNIFSVGTKSDIDSKSVYNTIISLKSKYPDGTSWGNSAFYSWKGGVYTTGYGCAGFAFMLSDAAFGNLPARRYGTYNPSSVRVGDIINYSVPGSNHFIVVLEVLDDGYIIVEGNVNQAIYWGRKITHDEIKPAFIEHLTRYPIIESGDVNFDSAVDASDASLVLAEYARVQTSGKPSFSESRVTAADVNNDGVVDASDASKILAYYAAISTGKKATWN